YNTVLQRAAYVCDELGVAVTEFAYYAARNWQRHLGNHHLLPVPTPLRDTYVLWRFTLQQPTHVIDVEVDPPVPLAPFVLLNSEHYYDATQWLPTHVNVIPTIR